MNKIAKLYIEEIGTIGHSFRPTTHYRLIMDVESGSRTVEWIDAHNAGMLLQDGRARWAEEMPESRYYQHNPMNVSAIGCYINDHREWERIAELPHQAVQMYFGENVRLCNKDFARCGRDYRYEYSLYNHDGSVYLYRKEI